MAPFLGEKKLGSTSQTPGDSEGSNDVYQETGLVNFINVIPKQSNVILVKESVVEVDLNIEADVRE